MELTDRKEDALRESERRFATILENARAYVYRCRNDIGYPNDFASILQAHSSDLTLDPCEGGGSVFGFELEAV